MRLQKQRRLKQFQQLPVYDVNLMCSMRYVVDDVAELVRSLTAFAYDGSEATNAVTHDARDVACTAQRRVNARRELGRRPLDVYECGQCARDALGEPSVDFRWVDFRSVCEVETVTRPDTQHVRNERCAEWRECGRHLIAVRKKAVVGAACEHDERCTEAQQGVKEARLVQTGYRSLKRRTGEAVRDTPQREHVKHPDWEQQAEPPRIAGDQDRHVDDQAGMERSGKRFERHGGWFTFARRSASEPRAGRQA